MEHLKPEPAKVQVVIDWPVPVNRKKLEKLHLFGFVSRLPWYGLVFHALCKASTYTAHP